MEDPVYSVEQYCALVSFDSRKKFVLNNLYKDRKLTMWQWEHECITIGLVDKSNYAS